MKNNKRIYLSGKITNNDNYKQDFERAYIYCKNKFDYDIINPSALINVLPNGTWNEYLDICISLLKISDSIFMINDWENSKGAILEYKTAKEIGIEIIFEEEIL